MPTLFERIIVGDLPCHKVYEDEHVFAFLDINPFSPCHTLVVPKEPAPSLVELSDEASAAVGRVLPRIARAVLAVSGATDFNVLQNNGDRAYQSVFHVHFHVIPMLEDGRGLTWPFRPSPLDATTGAEQAAALRRALEQSS